ncbi:serine hydrolase domain-containing protein [Microbacterium sp. LWO13-1.2]|uniref:serine hydrolase domain-containing protein n=1 Tax=Microbacterium sp. LWO13-1.2 TaxID=3135262 RepID=UPI003139B3CA
MRRLLCALSSVALVLSIAGCSSAEREPDEALPSTTNDRLAAAFDVLEREMAPVIVAFSHDGAPAVVREFGALRDDAVAPEKSLVDIGSITKTVTAVAVSKLVEQSGVRFDETLSDIFHEVPSDKAMITVEQLLTHAGGFTESVGDDAEEINRDEFLQRAFASPLVETPGTQYAYSNVGYSILAAIIEVRSGLSYEQYLRDEVLAPAGLDSIGYLSSYDDGRSLRSTEGKGVIDASWGGHDASWHLIGNGGLITTAENFLGFLQALLNGKVVSESSLEQLLHPHIAEDASGTSFYGYGLVVQDVAGIGRFYWHDGGNDVFSAEWSVYADHDDVIFVAGREAVPGASTASEAMSVLRDHLYGRR